MVTVSVSTTVLFSLLDISGKPLSTFETFANLSCSGRSSNKAAAAIRYVGAANPRAQPYEPKVPQDTNVYIKSTKERKSTATERSEVRYLDLRSVLLAEAPLPPLPL